MNIGDKFIELDKRNLAYFGHERIVTVLEITPGGTAICQSNTNKPGTRTPINLRRLENPKLFKLLKGEADE